MSILDIGGGFTGSEFQLKQVGHKPLVQIFAFIWKTPSECMFVVTVCVQVESAVRPLLDAYFSPLSGVQVLAQPGCFYVASAFNLAVNVIGKKVVTRHWDSLTQGEILNSLRFSVISSPVKSD